MPNPFCAAILLAFEAQRVIELTIGAHRVGRGAGAEAAEIFSMDGEKEVAAMEAANTLLAGGSQGQVISRIPRNRGRQHATPDRLTRTG